MFSPPLAGAPSRIDTSNCLAHGLVAAYDFSEPAAIDLTQRSAGRWPAGNAMSVGRAGPGLLVNSPVSSGASPRAAISSGLTVLWVAERLGPLGDFSDFLFGDFAAEGGNYNWGFYESQASGILIFYVHNGTTSVSAGVAGAWTTGAVNAFATTYGDGDGNIRLYKNGTEIASAAQTGNVRAATGTALRSCGWQTGTRNHRQYLGFVWNRRLSAAEISLVSASPRGLFAPQRRVWLPPTLAGGVGGTVGLSLEADDASGLSGASFAVLGRADEADAGLGLGGTTAGAAGAAVETDAATALGGNAAGTLGLSTEPDHGIGRPGAQVGAVGASSEADSGTGLVQNGGEPTVGRADEADAGLGLGGEILGGAGLASSVEEAPPVVGAITGSPGRADEHALALALFGSLGAAAGACVEIDAALGLNAETSGGAADPAAVWSHMLANGLTAGQTLAGVHQMLSDLTGSGPSAGEIAAAVLAAMNTTPPGVDVRKMNGFAVVGTGSPGDLWRGAP